MAVKNERYSLFLFIHACARLVFLSIHPSLREIAWMEESWAGASGQIKDRFLPYGCVFLASRLSTPPPRWKPLKSSRVFEFRRCTAMILHATDNQKQRSSAHRLSQMPKVQRQNGLGRLQWNDLGESLWKVQLYRAEGMSALHTEPPENKPKVEQERAT